MCGITGIYAFNQLGRLHMINLVKATSAIQSRGPDFQQTFHDEFVGLGHRRLSIIDPSPDGNQPMSDVTGKYHLIYNGEIYNYGVLRQQLEAKGCNFRSTSDTEVLLYLLIHEGINGLKKLNGFFAFAFYDVEREVLLLVRDRFGIKPLYYQADDDKFLFASEMKSLFAFGIDKNLDFSSLHLYLQLNYVPAPFTMLQNVKKLEPGRYIEINRGNFFEKSYYDIENANPEVPADYEKQKDQFASLLEASVTARLVSDVPLGSFLSGGIDSSVIAALAARHVDGLQTFSIGYKDEPFFDETTYATRVASHIGSKHHVFMLSNAELYENVFDILDYLDEPFADSSAIAVYILSKRTREHVTVALSGDGADEILGGYNKHLATLRILHPGIVENGIAGFGPLWNILPQSRNNALTNRFRQFARFAEVYKLPPKERYWHLATFMSSPEASKLMMDDGYGHESTLRREKYLGYFVGEESLGNSLLSDLNLVLPNDMLTKVDLMSMANSLEIRVPFLDHRVVEFLLALPDDVKIAGRRQKRILKDTFSDILPRSILRRGKHGFEVPLLKWFRREMHSLIYDELLSREYIIDQGIFRVEETEVLKKRLLSSNPADVHASIWALVVFQWWYRKYFS